MKPGDTKRIGDFIKSLSEEELVYLNRPIVERVNLIYQAKSTSEMAKCNIGERVQFEDNGGKTIKGWVVNLNKKTVSALADDHQGWNVAPVLLRSSETK